MRFRISCKVGRMTVDHTMIKRRSIRFGGPPLPLAKIPMWVPFSPYAGTNDKELRFDGFGKVLTTLSTVFSCRFQVFEPGHFGCTKHAKRKTTKSDRNERGQNGQSWKGRDCLKFHPSNKNRGNWEGEGISWSFLS